MRVWTIGHSNHAWANFVSILRVHGISALVDVRSYARSKFPQFNENTMRERLVAMGIEYFHLGEKLGGRPADCETPDYEATARSVAFSAGLDRVEHIAKQQRLVLMCSEHDPLTCHRSLLVGRRLAERGANVEHILRDGTIEPHEEAEDRLLSLTSTKTHDLFVSSDARLAAAYRIQAETLHRKIKSRE